MIKRTTEGGATLFLVDDVSPEDIAMLQALYSRSSKSVEKHLAKIETRSDVLKALREACAAEVDKEAANARKFAQSGYSADAFVNYAAKHIRQIDVDAWLAERDAGGRSESFMSKFYVGYNHKSIGDCGTTTLFVENVSMLAAKAIQDNPLYCGQETSTRFIDFSNRKMIDPIGTPESKAILERWIAFYSSSAERVASEIRRRHPRRDDEAEDAYERAVAARSFDVRRGFLPAAATTQLSWHTNLRQAGDMLTRLLYHPLAEVREIAEGLAAMLIERYPSSGMAIGAAGVSGSGGNSDEREAWTRRMMREAACARHGEWRPSETEKYPLVGGTALEFRSTLSSEAILPWKAILSDRPKGCVLPHFLSDLGQLSFRFALDFGSFRDVQRHRNGVCKMPYLDVCGGFESWYLEQLDDGLRAEAEALIDRQAISILELDCDWNDQYYCAMGYRVPVSISYGLPAVVYVMELRSGKTIHPTLRSRVHAMIRAFEEKYPGVPLHVDRDPDDWSLRRGSQTIEERR